MRLGIADRQHQKALPYGNGDRLLRAQERSPQKAGNKDIYGKKRNSNARFEQVRTASWAGARHSETNQYPRFFCSLWNSSPGAFDLRFLVRIGHRYRRRTHPGRLDSALQVNRVKQVGVNRGIRPRHIAGARLRATGHQQYTVLTGYPAQDNSKTGETAALQDERWPEARHKKPRTAYWRSAVFRSCCVASSRCFLPSPRVDQFGFRRCHLRES